MVRDFVVLLFIFIDKFCVIGYWNILNLFYIRLYIIINLFIVIVEG